MKYLAHIPRCTFCSLLCPLMGEVGDSSVESGRKASEAMPSFMTPGTCPLRQRMLHESQYPSSVPADTLEARIACAGELLRNAERVEIIGGAMSVATSRAVENFSRLTGATLELSGGDAAFGWITEVQRCGGFFTTFAEIAALCDLAVFVGNDRLFDAYPLLPEALWPTQHRPTRILLVGKFGTHTAASLAARLEPATNVAGPLVESVDIDADALARFFRCDSTLTPLAIGHGPALQQLSYAIAQAHSRTLILSPPHIDAAYSQLLYTALLNYVLLKASERSTAILPLGGAATTLQQTLTWRTGWPGRIHYSESAASYDPRLHRRQSAESTVTARGLEIYISELNSPADPTLTRSARSHLQHVNRIFIGCYPTELRPEDIVVPVSRIGIEHGGTMFRSDSAVAFYCPQTADAAPVTARGILQGMPAPATATNKPRRP